MRRTQSRLALCDDPDDTRVVPSDVLTRLLQDEAIQLARLRAIRELYAAGDAVGALSLASLLQSDLHDADDDVVVEVVGEDEVELIVPSRIVMMR